MKDQLHTAGIRTTFGTPIFNDFVPDEDAAVISSLKSAGAILLGKEKMMPGLQVFPEGLPGKSRLRDWLDVILGPHLPDEGFNKDWDLVVDDPAKVPGAVSEILNRLQAECFYTGDGLDIKGVISLGVPLEKPEGQASSSPCG